MNCKKFQEELVFLYFDNEMGQDLTVSYEHHMACCPECAHEAQHTTRVLTIVRERSVRATAPMSLRQRILAGLPRGPRS